MRKNRRYRHHHRSGYKLRLLSHCQMGVELDYSYCLVPSFWAPLYLQAKTEETAEAEESRQPWDEHWTAPVPNGDATGHPVRRLPLHAVSGFAVHFPQAGGETHLQVSKIHPWIWSLIFCGFFSGFGGLFWCRFRWGSVGSQVDIRHLSISRYIFGVLVLSQAG